MVLNSQTLLRVAATLALATLPSQAYFILSHPILEVTRLDPIISPGVVSSHVHTIIGGNNFQATMDYSTTQEATCTTAPISIDKSSYWTPQLYSYSNGEYTLIPASSVNTYYLPRTDAPPQAFPEGHRMISGNPNRRTFNASDPNDQAISFVCLLYQGQNVTGNPDYHQRNSFFDVPCDSMRLQLNFPTCSDGRLDSDNHQDHMAWPSNGLNGGACPESHPIPLVQLFYEFIYPVGDFPFVKGATNYVLANGDTTGYGFHGDFISGWPTINGVNVLQEAITNCNDNFGVGGELENCPPFVPYLDTAAANACLVKNLEVEEDIGIGHALAKLPGNNLIWIGNSTTKPTIPGYVETATITLSPNSTIPANWTSVGCIAEGTSGRALAGSTFSNDNMTRGACVSFCAGGGYAYAGVEYGRECYCDSTLRNGATNTTLDSTKCGMRCAGSTTENCGGSSTLQLFYNPSNVPSAPTLPTGWVANGCRTEATNSRTLAGSSKSSSSMTVATCVNYCDGLGYTNAGIEYASECYCGNGYVGSGGCLAATGDCSMVCSGNSLQTCGGPNRLTTYVKTIPSTTSGKRRSGGDL